MSGTASGSRVARRRSGRRHGMRRTHVKLTRRAASGCESPCPSASTPLPPSVSSQSRSLPRPTLSDMRAMIGLALPVVVVQVGWMAMGVVDTMMVGHLSADALAAVALGNLYFFGVTIFGMGVLMALDPIVAQAVGARDAAAVARGVQRGLVLSLALSVVLVLLLLPSRPVLELLRQPAAV